MSLGNKLAIALVAGAAALVMTPEAAEAGTVVASSGPSAGTYPVGSQIGDTQRVTLQQGDRITVLDGGRTRVWDGPGTYILATRGADAGNTVLAALTSTSTRSRARTGTVRGTEGTNEPTNPNLWYVDVEASGTVCLSNVDRVNLWRAPSDQEAVYMIAPADDPDGGVSATFAANEMLARWDSALQLRDGATYMIGQESDEEPAEVTITILTDVPADDPEAIAQALISNGCTLQLGQIVSAANPETAGS